MKWLVKPDVHPLGFLRVPCDGIKTIHYVSGALKYPVPADYPRAGAYYECFGSTVYIVEADALPSCFIPLGEFDDR